MNKKSFIFGSLIFLTFAILAAYFPLTGIDITWSLHSIDSFTSLISTEGTGILTTVLMSIFIKYKILKIVLYGLFGVALFALMRDTVSKKNTTLMAIAFFLFFLLDRMTIATSLVQTHGFASSMLGLLCLLLFMRLFINNTIPKMNHLVLFLLGIISMQLKPAFSFTILLVTIIHILPREDKTEPHHAYLILGELFGIINIILGGRFAYTGFTNNLIHSFIPSICESNFIITLIFSALVMSEAIKVYNMGKTKGSTLAIFGMASFLFSSLLSSNDYINYITFFLYAVSSLYILLNVTNSRLFKYKIQVYYLFNFIYIIMLAPFGTVDLGSNMFLFITEILIILELYDHLLPADFIYPIWLIALLATSGMNIYIYKTAATKYDEMNVYIKNKLECSTEDVLLPSKYESDFLIDYIPKSKNSIDEYIEFYHIDPYDKEKENKFEFRKNAK